MSAPVSMMATVTPLPAEAAYSSQAFSMPMSIPALAGVSATPSERPEKLPSLLRAHWR
jgi:hypothetical protein